MNNFDALRALNVTLLEHFAPKAVKELLPETEGCKRSLTDYLALEYFAGSVEYLLTKGVQFDAVKRYIDDAIRNMTDIDVKAFSTFVNERVNFAGAIKAAEIRNDFAAALSSVDYGWKLSEPLHWGFHPKDLARLAKLHKANVLREKIEDLLDDCNFHKECGDFSSGNYDEYLAYGLDKAKELINDYCLREFGEEADFTNLHKVHIAYTTITDEELQIQVTADLVDYKIVTEIEGDVVKTEQYNDLEEMSDFVFDGLSFDDLITSLNGDGECFGLHMPERLNEGEEPADASDDETEDRATPEEMKQECLERLRMFHTCNGTPERELEFEDKLNKSERMGKIPGVLFWLNNEELEAVRRWERETGNKVYHVIFDRTEFGPWYTFLYVNKDKSEWRVDREDLSPVAENKEAEILAYVYTGDYNSEYGYVRVRPRNGGVERTA